MADWFLLRPQTRIALSTSRRRRDAQAHLIFFFFFFFSSFILADAYVGASLIEKNSGLTVLFSTILLRFCRLFFIFQKKLASSNPNFGSVFTSSLSRNLSYTISFSLFFPFLILTEREREKDRKPRYRSYLGWVFFLFFFHDRLSLSHILRIDQDFFFFSFFAGWLTAVISNRNLQSFSVLLYPPAF